MPRGNYNLRSSPSSSNTQKNKVDEEHCASKISLSNKEKLKGALEEIKNFSISVSRASKRWGIPKTTLWRKIDTTDSRFFLTEEEEKTLKEIIATSNLNGRPLKKIDVMERAARLKQQRTRKPCDLPSDMWWRGFKKDTT
jgi:hypothetical protein